MGNKLKLDTQYLSLINVIDVRELLLRRLNWYNLPNLHLRSIDFSSRNSVIACIVDTDSGQQFHTEFQLTEERKPTDGLPKGQLAA
ncbi:MAG: hypothetical protein VW226_04580 [Rhodospirillaceae bacterium]